MEQELFNQLLANSPAVVILLYIVKQMSNLSERVAKIEGTIYENYRRIKK